MPADLKVARAALHMWEEPCISGKAGSGAIFFSGCSVGCVFCQNHAIAAGQSGKSISIERLADIFLELQTKGANNINLVTPEHYAPSIALALAMAKAKGLHLPIICNCSGYSSLTARRILSDHVNVWLPDFKYYSPELSRKYSHAPDYFTVAESAERPTRKSESAPFFIVADCGSSCIHRGRHTYRQTG